MATKRRTARRTANEALAGVAIHPGEHLAEILAERKLSQLELARRMDRPAQLVNAICRGVKGITAETALQLERVLGLSAETWMNLQSGYELTKARLELNCHQPARAAAAASARVK